MLDIKTKIAVPRNEMFVSKVCNVKEESGCQEANINTLKQL